MKQNTRMLLRKGAAVLMMAVLTGMYAMGCGAGGNELVLTETAESSVSGEELTPAADLESSIFVHVCGEVNRPGVYEIPEGSRIIDAVERAGGMTGEADADSLNLARIIADGEQIRIPGRNEAVREGTPEEQADDRVNINTAAKEELMRLPGIGDSRAEDILAYRAKKRFEVPEDIMKVPGIKEGAFRKLEGKIRTE